MKLRAFPGEACHRLAGDQIDSVDCASVFINYAGAEGSCDDLAVNISNVSPVFACGVPRLGPEIIALIVAWFAIIPLAVVNAILTVMKCKSKDERMIHFAILAISAMAFANLYGAFSPHDAPPLMLACVLGLPIAIYGQFVALLIRRRAIKQNGDNGLKL